MPVATQSAPRDPRSIVTPDAFEVSGDMLGLPLAAPSRRLAAILIDLAVIGFITIVTSSFAMVLGVVAAVFFIKVSFERTEVRGSVFGRAMRFSLGCLGVFIGVVTAIVWGSILLVDDGPQVGDVPASAGESAEAPSLEGIEGLGALLAGFADVRRMREAATAQEAEEAATEVATLLLGTGVTRAEAEEILAEAVPEAAAWADDADEVVERALDRAVRGLETSEPPASGAAGAVAELSTAEALQRYAELLGTPPAGPEEEEALLSLRARLIEDVARDSLDALAEQVADLERVAASRQQEIRGLREALREEREGGGFFSAMRNFVDELGFGFGWASLYMTVLLTWWKGQTVGKRLMGVRVLRLDGGPITWWVAFERAGGYAAGFATGLLGFAQVWWDANRQAIHDRIVGTVVVLDGAPRVGNWEQAI